MRTISLCILASIASPVLAQAADPTRAYIDSAFSRMDADANGQIDRAEFERFMTARIARQKARFDAEFDAADTNKDGRIDRDEAAAANPLLADRFDDVDSNADGFVTAAELRVAIISTHQAELPDQ